MPFSLQGEAAVCWAALATYSAHDTQANAVLDAQEMCGKESVLVFGHTRTHCVQRIAVKTE